MSSGRAIISWWAGAIVVAIGAFHLLGIADIHNQDLQPARLLVALLAGCLATLGCAATDAMRRRR